MRFRKYSSIENSYRTEFIERIRLEGEDSGDWIVTEKIHGANFSIWVNATRTYMAKRSAIMPDDTGFYNVYNISHELKEKARNIYRGIHPKPEVLAIYGELFGGCYPHPKVRENLKYKKVQQGVWYCPDLQFAVFDIRDDDGFLNFDEMTHLCNQVGFFTVPVVYHGSFNDCLKCRNDYSSVVHQEWHLPKIKGNIMEGVVIRPQDTRYLRRGERVIIKSKNRKFSETRDKKPRKVIKLSKIGREISGKIQSMITENRYDCIVSKIGEVVPSHFGQIMKEFNKDILEETPSLINELNALEKSEQKIIRKNMNYDIATIVRKKLILGK